MDEKLLKLKKIEKLLLPEGVEFDKERRDFIFNNETLDLVACAGSGKTTALIAKLLLLTEDFPFEGNKGICVLTHTNVAIDEIKDKIGIDHELFHYPNFFGTIQQFVDKFLAIPAYKKMFHQSPIINEDLYYSQWDKKYLFLKKNAKILCKRNPKKNLPYSVCKNYRTGKISTHLLGDELNINLPNISEDEKKEVLKSFKDRKIDIIKSGVLSYNDTYTCAFWYIKKYPFLADVISSRFKFLFIDEMQDTAEHQLELIDTIFKNRETKVQKIGDPNQAIYNSEIKKTIWEPQSSHLSLTGSVRFSSLIGNCIKSVRHNTEDELFGNESINNIPPCIFLYEKNTINNVVTEFIDLINSNESKILLKTGDKIKVIGWNGKSEEEGGNGESLHKYIPHYSKKIQNKKQYFSNLITYLELSKQEFFRKKSLKIYQDLVLKIISRFLYEQGIKINEKYPTEKRVFKYFKDNINFKEYQFDFVTRLIFKDDIRNDISQFLLDFVFNYFEQKNLTSEAENFINSDEIEDFSVKDETKNSNSCGEVGGIPIEVASIHSVKGETHKATLYVETKFRSFDLEKIVPYLLGERASNISDTEEYRLKMCYVGMSRASHLLCLAMRKEAVEVKNLGQLKKCGWNIVDIS